MIVEVQFNRINEFTMNYNELEWIRMHQNVFTINWNKLQYIILHLQ